jgi:hypothetical protein
MNQPFNNQFHTQRLRESIDETSATPAEGAYLTKPGAKKKSPKPTSGYKEVKGYRPGHSKLKIVEPKDLWNLNETQFKEIVLRSDKDKIQQLLTKVKDLYPKLYDKFIGWMADPYPHDYSEFEDSLPPELAMNETGEKPQPSKEMDYPSGEKVEVGQKIRIDNEQIENGYGVITGFAQDADDNDVILVTVERDDDSSIPRENVPVQLSDIEKMEEEKPLQEGDKTDEILTLIKQLKQSGKLKPEAQQVIMQWMQHPSASEDEIIRVLRLYGGSPNKTSIQEGVKTEIARRNKPQQFQEAAKMVNKKLKEINNILEYAEQLKSELDESSRPNHLMEKMKKGMVSAYNKMRKL